MRMRLAPLFTSEGKMLGHINLTLCIESHNCWMTDEHAGRLGAYRAVPAADVKDTVRIFRFGVKRMRFRWDEDEQTVRYLVCDKEIPEWVWKAVGIKFQGGGRDWEIE